ncbi:MAG: CBS domain-containing protein [Desulfobacteraceae bacterium]|nr:MAG: CBS domain-containing protein [Desulfobacteraceae bacterium]
MSTKRPFNVSSLFIRQENSIREAMDCIDRNHKGIALIVDDESRLLGTITDGDVRRAILAGKSLGTSVSELLDNKAKAGAVTPISVSVGTDSLTLLKLMQQHGINQIPVVDPEGRVVDLVILSELLPDHGLQLKAVIMAGGYGTRLRPLTDDLPKPMLPVGGRPLMETILQQLQQAGVRNVNVMTHFKSEKIIEYFGDGRKFGLELSYVNEDRPLGTGGSLGLLNVPDEPLLVMNGDILTGVDIKAMLAYHHESRADMTVGIRRYEIQVPYGVIECEGSKICSLNEKPDLSFYVNAGIYIIEPSVYQHMPIGEHFNMTDLIQWLINAKANVVGFPIREYWLDIGQHEDYMQAQEDVLNGKVPI